MSYSDYQDRECAEVLEVVCKENYVRVMLRSCKKSRKIYFSIGTSDNKDYQLMTELSPGGLVWINPFTEKILFDR